MSTQTANDRHGTQPEPNTSRPIRDTSPTQPTASISSYNRCALHNAIRFYREAAKTGILLPGRAFSSFSSSSILRTLLSVVPYRFLLLHTLWSISANILIMRFSTIKHLIPPSLVPTAAGTSLFILLAFLVADTTSRHRTAIENLHQLCVTLQHLSRKLHISYPQGTWHSFDRSRVLAHIAAFPIALALHLRKVRSPEPLRPLLHPTDIEAILNAPSPHLHCSMVVRAYFAAAEDDSLRNFSAIAATKTPCGLGTRNIHVQLISHIDYLASSIDRISTARVAQGYLTHIRIFLYVWLMLIPVSLSIDTKWFTPLWSFLVAYSLATVFEVAVALQTPFALTRISVPLEKLSASFAATLLCDAVEEPSYSKLLTSRNNGGEWLDGALQRDAVGYAPPNRQKSSSARQDVLRLLFRPSISVVIFLSGFSVWTVGLMLLSCGSTKANRLNSLFPSYLCMSVEIPITFSTLGYVGTAMFLLLSFWTHDAYSRFERALRLWRVEVRPSLEWIANRVLLLTQQGFWHEGDHRRFTAHLAALPVAMKLHLREIDDTSQLREIVGDEDGDSFENDKRPFPTHCADVILAYLDSADAGDPSILPGTTEQGVECPFGISRFFLQGDMWRVQRALWECVAINLSPTSPAFTLHLKVFVTIWVMLLPVVVVQRSGWLSFPFVLPIAYSVINLVHVSDNLRELFDDSEDSLPLDSLCKEIRDSVHRIYRKSRAGSQAYVMPGNPIYSRDDFNPRVLVQVKENGELGSPTTNAKGDNRGQKKNVRRMKLPNFSLAEGWNDAIKDVGVSALKTDELPTVRVRTERLTLWGSLQRQLVRFPAISFASCASVILWSVATVFTSKHLSAMWNMGANHDCTKWCSPIDVHPAILRNLGFALFLIISLRATDAVGRYDSGAMLMFDLGHCTRELAFFLTHGFEDGFFHEGDKERIVAHLVQLPICLVDMLRGEAQGRRTAHSALLSESDVAVFQASPSPIEHLMETLEAYFLVQESPSRVGWALGSDASVPLNLAGHHADLMNKLRTTVAIASFINQCVVMVASLRRHERLFATFWLALLPMSLTSELGYYTIFWAPLISYGVLSLQDIANQLMDPFGNDKGDLPMEKLATQATDGVLDAMYSAGWDTSRLCKAPQESGVIARVSGLGVCFTNGILLSKVYPPLLAGTYHEDDGISEDSPMFAERAIQRKEASLYAHMIHSTPWRKIAASFSWAFFICTVRSAIEGKMVKEEVWRSTTAVSTSLLNGASFGVFLLLGYFVSTGCDRYEKGIAVWESGMRPYCHTLASCIQTLTEKDLVHVGGKRRLLGLVAAIPLLLKHEMRGNRDMRDVSGLMSKDDLSRAACSESMVTYCADVIRTHLTRILMQREALVDEETSHPGPRAYFFRNALRGLEGAVRDARYLKMFGVAPCFKSLLNSLLFIFLAILPFILFQRSGTFCIHIFIFSLASLHRTDLMHQVQNFANFDLTFVLSPN